MIRSVLIFIFSVVLIAFFFVLNFRLALFSADKINALADESNLYQVTSAILRDEIASGIKGTESENFVVESLNEALSPAIVEDFGKDVINQTFASIKDPIANPSITIRYSKLDLQEVNLIKSTLDQETQEKMTIPEDQVIDVATNPFVIGLSKINRVLSILAGIALFLLAIILLASKGAGGKLLWTGSAFISAAILLALSAGAIYVLSQGVISAANLSSISIDERITVLVRKILTLAINKEKLYYAIEIVSSFVLGLVLVVIGKATSKKPEISI